MTAEEFLERTTDPEILVLASLVFSREGMTEESMRRVTMLQDLKSRIEKEIVHFYYRKGDGSLRSAYGTRDSDLIRQYVGEGNNEQKDRQIRTFTYFDVGRGDWRSFRPETIDRIDQEYAL